MHGVTMNFIRNMFTFDKDSFLYNRGFELCDGSVIKPINPY